MTQKNYSNFHMHTYYCDGKNSIEEFIKMAVSKNMSSIGFSGHSPIHFDNKCNMKPQNLIDYINEVKHFKNLYKGIIEIYLGLEMDYLEGDNRKLVKEYENELDYKIGSVHMLFEPISSKHYAVDWTIDEINKAIKYISKGNSKEFVIKYYENIIKILKEESFDILGHFDLIKKNNQNNKIFNPEENWYKEITMDALLEVKKSNVLLEVNTGGITRGYIEETYPSKYLLEKALEIKIPIVINSDAHAVENICGKFEETIEILKGIGFKSSFILQNNNWIEKRL